MFLISLPLFFLPSPSIFWSPCFLQKIYLSVSYLCFIFLFNSFLLWASHATETMKYLNWSIWFISPNIIISKCIHFPPMPHLSFLTVFSLSNHLLVDIQDAFNIWLLWVTDHCNSITEYYYFPFGTIPERRSLGQIFWTRAQRDFKCIVQGNVSIQQNYCKDY